MILQDIQTFSRAINIRIALRFLTILSNAMVMPYMAVFFVQKIGAEITTLFVIFIGATSILGYLFGGRLPYWLYNGTFFKYPFEQSKSIKKSSNCHSFFLTLISQNTILQKQKIKLHPRTSQTYP